MHPLPAVAAERPFYCERKALLGRQLLAWALRRYCKDEVRDRNTARKAMASLLAAVRRTPPPRAAFDRLVQAIRGNLAMEGGEELYESETLDILESMYDALPDFRSQMELHREQDRSSRTSEGLLARMQNIVDRDDEKRQRSQQEDAFSKQLG